MAQHTGGLSYLPSSRPTPSVPVKLKKKKPAVMPKPKAKHPPLAKPKLKTQAVPKPYDPYAPLDPKAIEENARARAQSQIQPTLDNLNTVDRDTAGAHATRQQELGTWYGNLQGSIDKSYGNTAQALNQLITLNSQGNQETSGALAAALASANQPVNDAAAMMGGAKVAPPSQDAAILAAANANAANQNNFVGANAANALSAQGARDATLANVGRIDAGNMENRRYGAQTQELQSQRRDAMGRIPDLMNTARTDIQGQEVQKMQLSEAQKNRLFQQYLATQELGLKKKNETFQEWLASQNLGLQGEQLSLDKQKFRTQTQIDWANVGINQKQAEATLARINQDVKDAKTGAQKERAQLRAKQWTTGLDMLSAYMAPQKGEGSPGDNRTSIPDPKDDTVQIPQKVYRRSYDDALRTLTGKARMAKSDALRLLASSDLPSWRKRAQLELKGGKGDTRGLVKTATKSVGSVANNLKKNPIQRVK